MCEYNKHQQIKQIKQNKLHKINTISQNGSDRAILCLYYLVPQPFPDVLTSLVCVSPARWHLIKDVVAYANDSTRQLTCL